MWVKSDESDRGKKAIEYVIPGIIYSTFFPTQNTGGPPVSPANATMPSLTSNP